jgi:hypothetical protein
MGGQPLGAEARVAGGAFFQDGPGGVGAAVIGGDDFVGKAKGPASSLKQGTTRLIAGPSATGGATGGGDVHCGEGIVWGNLREFFAERKLNRRSGWLSEDLIGLAEYDCLCARGWC